MINNAAIGDSGSASEVSIDKYKTVFETNVFSALELTQAVFDNMIKKMREELSFYLPYLVELQYLSYHLIHLANLP